MELPILALHVSTVSIRLIKVLYHIKLIQKDLSLARHTPNYFLTCCIAKFTPEKFYFLSKNVSYVTVNFVTTV